MLLILKKLKKEHKESLKVTNSKMNENLSKKTSTCTKWPKQKQRVWQTDQEARKEILPNSSKRLSKSKKSYKATKRRKAKQVDPKTKLDTETENNILFWRTRTINNFWMKSCVPKHQLQTRSKIKPRPNIFQWGRDSETISLQNN